MAAQIFAACLAARRKPKLGTLLIWLCALFAFDGALLVGTKTYMKWWMTNEVWDMELSTRACQAGSLQAAADFRVHKKRLFQLAIFRTTAGEISSPVFSGRMDGPFQLWIYPTYEFFGYPHRLSNQTFAKCYNSQMRRLERNKGHQKTSGMSRDLVRH